MVVAFRDLKKMKLCISILTSLFFLSVVKSQRLRYATRFRNFSVDSDTGSIDMLNISIFQHGMDHRLAGWFNITKDVHAKNIHVVVNRCFFERSACEYFQTWKFSENLKGIVYMKNQIWTPIFTSLKPRLDFPIIKKNVYHTSNAYINTEALVLFYPEVIKYYWQADAILHDLNDKRGVVLKFDFSIFEFVERNRKREQGDTKA